MSMRRYAVVLLVSLAVMGSEALAQSGGARYVATAGSDAANDCAVAANPCATLRHALAVADAGDVLTVAAGTYTESDLAIVRDVTIRGAGPGLTIIQAASAPGLATTRVFDVDEGVAVGFESITIRHGRTVPELAGWPSGAAVHAAYGAQIRLTNCIVEANFVAGDSTGGALDVHSGSLTAIRSTFRGNAVEVGHGGAIAAVSSSLAFDECVFEGNQVGGDGGALWLRSGDLTVLRSTFRRNTAQGGGGAILLWRGNEMPAIGRIEESVFHDNESGGDWGGGALFLRDATVGIANSTLEGNLARGSGGSAVSIDQLSVTTDIALDHTTIAGNRMLSSTGAGIHNTDAHVRLKNVIAAGNRGPAGQPSDCIGSFQSFGNNLIGATEGCVLAPVAGAGPDISGQEPLLGALADNGGPTWTMALWPGSPAIDAGTCADVDGRPVAIDQRGVPRPVGAGCDIGAYEGIGVPTTATTPPTASPTAPLPTATPTPTPWGASVDPRACPRLRAPAQAIQAALANPAAVYGWQMLCNPNVPHHPVHNTRRIWLQLRDPNLAYHPVANDLVYGCGCR